MKSNIKIGVLGGGQLGRMLCQEATKMDIDLFFLDKSDDFPVPRMYPGFIKGDFNNYDDVLAFGKDLDIITIEIENVNTDALAELEKMGKKVYPQSKVISIIKDKGIQKDFYKQHNIPTSDYQLVDSKQQVINLIESDSLSYPFIQKSRLAGYDGKGVVAIRSESDLNNIFDCPSVIEKLISIDKELAVIIARNADGATATFDTTEMEFYEKGNLLDMLISPARVSNDIADKCKKMAIEIIEKLDMVGILAVEFFLTKSKQILVNEVAPRPHNSGHHTIDACHHSQYNLMIRSILGLPLVSPRQHSNAVMINILGEDGKVGEPNYSWMDSVLKHEGVIPHIYGKLISKPLRKMGHINILSESMQGAIKTAQDIKKEIKIKLETKAS